MPFSRRDFVKTSVLGALATGVGAQASVASKLGGNGRPSQDSSQASQFGPYKRPIIVCANNGYAYLEDAFVFLKGGGDTLDAALKVVKGPEDDPNDDSVGLGGLPNEEGVVELDACCMHGPTRRAGSVGGVRNIKNVSLVSKAVMQHTGHVMLVGEGAERRTCSPSTPERSGCCGRNFTPLTTGGGQASPIRTGSPQLLRQPAINHGRNYCRMALGTCKLAQQTWASHLNVSSRPCERFYSRRPVLFIAPR